MAVFHRKYNTLLVTGTTAIRIPIVKRAVVDFAVGADWTPAAGDVKIQIDGAAAANVTNLPTATAAGNTATWEFILTAAELSGKQMIITVADAATKAVEDQCFLVETFGNASAMYVADFSLANIPANVVQLLGTAWLTPGTAGTPDVNAKLVGGQTASASGTVTFPNATLASTTNITAGTITTTTNLTTNNDKTGYGLSAAAVQAIWDALTSALTTANSIGKRIVDYLTGDIYARVGVPAGASVSADVAAIKAVLPSALGANGNVKADVRDWLGTAASTPTVAGVPNVNAKTWNDLATVALPLVPTTAGRTLDVTATGEGGIDWSNIGAPTTVVGLSGTTIKAVTDAGADTAGVTTLLSRLSAARAGYLDNLSAGAVALASDMATMLARIGAFTGIGVNTILGFFKALLSKTASTPSDVGGTFTPTTDSTEAIRDRGDAAWGAGAVPSVADITAGVWNAVDLTYIAAGSKGEKLHNAGASGDSLANDLGDYDTPNTGGYVLAHLGRNKVEVVSATSADGGTMQLTQGDSEPTGLTLTVLSGLTGSTLHLYITHGKRIVLDLVGTVDSDTTAHFPCSSTQSALLEPHGYAFGIIKTSAGLTRTLVREGVFRVLSRVNPS